MLCNSPLNSPPLPAVVLCCANRNLLEYLQKTPAILRSTVSCARNLTLFALSGKYHCPVIGTRGASGRANQDAQCHTEQSFVFVKKGRKVFVGESAVESQRGARRGGGAGSLRRPRLPKCECARACVTSHTCGCRSVKLRRLGIR